MATKVVNKAYLVQTLKDFKHDVLDEQFIKSDSIRDVPVSDNPIRNVTGTYDSKFGNGTVTENGSSAHIDNNSTNSYTGAMFSLGNVPNQNIKIKVDVKNLTSQSIANNTTVVFTLFGRTTSGTKVSLGGYSCQVGKDKVFTVLLTPSDITAKSIATSPLVLGMSNNQDLNYDISISCEYGSSTIETIGELVNTAESIHKPLLGVKAMFLGDSITALTGDRSWVDRFIEMTGCEKIVNAAVAGAVLLNYEDTVLDGNPNSSNGNISNTLPNQVQKIINNNYENPDLIVIAIGTNSGIAADDTRLLNTFYTGTGDNKTSVPLEDLNLKTYEGAFRWCNEKLHRLYPNAIICWCNPIQGAHKDPQAISLWSDNLKKLTQWGGVVNIETNRCGIMMANEISGQNGEDLIDGLHPNANGAMKMARYNAAAISQLFI